MEFGVPTSLLRILVCKGSFRFGLEPVVHSSLPSLPYSRMFPATVISQATQWDSIQYLGRAGPQHAMAGTVGQVLTPGQCISKPGRLRSVRSVAFQSELQPGGVHRVQESQTRQVLGWGGDRSAEGILSIVPSLPASCRAGLGSDSHRITPVGNLLSEIQEAFSKFE